MHAWFAIYPGMQWSEQYHELRITINNLIQLILDKRTGFEKHWNIVVNLKKFDRYNNNNNNKQKFNNKNNIKLTVTTPHSVLYINTVS